MRLLFLGDTVGRCGREAACEAVKQLRPQLGLDLVVVNAENAAHGFGLTEKIAEELFDAGVDCITTGNHVFDQREMVQHIEREPRILRPVNYSNDTPGRGFLGLSLADGRRVLIINAIARLFMEMSDNPFSIVDRLLTQFPLGGAVAAILIDFHGEATSEKYAMGHFCDGRASLVVGTHTHVPTADLQILPAGTAYQSDAGMCGDYNSVIGMSIEPAVSRFQRKVVGERLQPTDGPATACGVFVETDDMTGLARRVAPVRIGGRLSPTVPALETLGSA